MPNPFNPSALDHMADRLNRYVDEGYLPGYVMMLGVGEESWIHHHGVQDLASGRPMAPDSIFRIASMSKSILAAATICLAEAGQLDLDAPVENWLPELADQRVLRGPASPLDETVPAVRPITTRHLLTLTWGLGALFNGLETTPLAQAMSDRGVSVDAFLPNMSPAQYLEAIGDLPLAFQPGEGWLYHSGFDVIPILIERVTGEPLTSVLQRTLFTPLGMVDTALSVPDVSLDRFTTLYADAGDGLTVFDPAAGGRWHQPFGLQGEFVSTASDFAAFAHMLLRGGDTPTGRILSADAVSAITSDHLTPAIKQAYPFFPGYWDDHGWGYGLAVQTEAPAGSSLATGTYGWSGGFNTHWQNDPSRDMVGIFLAQRLMGSPQDGALMEEIWQLAASSLTG